MKIFDKTKIKTKSLKERQSKSEIEKIAVNPDAIPEKLESEKQELIQKIAQQIVNSRKNKKPVILTFGAHLIKNGLSPIIIKMIEKDYLTHLATNGAGSIHDWEFAFQGKTEEDVRKYLLEGQFGIWEETGKYINLAVILGALKNKGYGESISEMIHEDKLIIPEDISQEIKKKLSQQNIFPGILTINHSFKKYSIQNSAFIKKIPFTVHPGFGYDIIYTHPLNNGESVGKASEIDFLKFVESVSNLEEGVYVSIGSAIMSPMIFEKALSMARNVKKQENKEIKNFMIIVNDIQEGNWDWNTEIEPPKSDPSYYLRFCKTFSRAGAREMHYIQENNKDFLLNLYHELKKIEKNAL